MNDGKPKELIRVERLGIVRSKKSMDYLHRNFSGITISAAHPITVVEMEDGSIEARYTAFSRINPDEFFPLLGGKKVQK
ncbi:MAG: hypothetical protein SO360_01940 [Bifidobacterium tsurumiense]|uniref:hypothetical protein n=1 Tax=Bifidobacterium tsurumiense TaxID=356829 RepID=UPI002A7F7F97|nr:hypothetical protein [Bifidobacterium tsurumiense]MDY4677614.1 hypothetical protein [Bifidobacterium tsurumiense]